MEKPKSMGELLTDKSHINLREGAIELTMLAFLRTAVENNEINRHKQ